MSKKTIVLILLVALVAICATQMLAQAPKPPDKVTLAQGVALGSVAFPHKTHVDSKVACTTCHHGAKPNKAGKSVAPKPFQKCVDCHTKTGTAEISKLQAAFHNPAASSGLCIDCHKKGGKAPTKCTQCHKK